MDLNHFSVEKISGHIYRIIDALEVACYLVTGEEKACLLQEEEESHDGYMGRYNLNLIRGRKRRGGKHMSNGRWRHRFRFR